MGPSWACLGSGHRVQSLHELGVERRRQPDGLRKARASGRRLSVQAFLVKEHRNAEPTLFDEEFLNGVSQLRLAARALAAARIAGAPDLSDAIAMGERSPSLLE